MKLSSRTQLLNEASRELRVIKKSLNEKTSYDDQIYKDFSRFITQIHRELTKNVKRKPIGTKELTTMKPEYEYRQIRMSGTRAEHSAWLPIKIGNTPFFFKIVVDIDSLRYFIFYHGTKKTGKAIHDAGPILDHVEITKDMESGNWSKISDMITSFLTTRYEWKTQQK